MDSGILRYFSIDKCGQKTRKSSARQEYCSEGARFEFDSFSDFAHLNSLYILLVIGSILVGIPALIIWYLSNSYTGIFASPITTKNPVYIRLAIYIQFLTLGFIPIEEFEGARFCIFGRVSTPSQRRGTDITGRLEPIIELATDTLDGQVVEKFTKSESGATMDRESLDKILRMAEDNLIDVLAVKNLDRLSRADPWETIDYLIKLKENDVVLYEHPRRFLDWDDLNDFQLIAQEIIFSRQWYERLEDGRIEGVHDELSKQRWPFKPHFGYTKDDDANDDERNIFIDEEEAPLVYRIFEIYNEVQNISKTQDMINDEYSEALDEELTYGRVRRILSSKLCIGKLEYEGEVINDIPDLSLVKESVFHEAQATLESRSRDEPDKIPQQVVDLTTTFGIEYAQSLLEQISFRKCQECGGALSPTTTTEVWGIPVEKVECESCDYEGPLISAEAFREVHQTAPLTCPFCYRSDEFDIRESPHGLDMHLYECTNCSHQFHTTHGTDEIERYLEHPDLGFTFNSTQRQSSAGDSDTEEATSQQMTLSDL